MKAYTLGLYEKAMPKTLTWKEKLDVARAAGYDFVEISIDETDEKLARLDWRREERRELVDLMYQIGLFVLCASAVIENILLEAMFQKSVPGVWKLWKRPFSLLMIWEFVLFSLQAMMFIMKSLLRKL